MVLVEIKVLWIGASNYQLMQGMYLFKKKKKQLVAFYAWSKKCFLKYFLSPPQRTICVGHRSSLGLLCV